jgi:hypothetical protein
VSKERLAGRKAVFVQLFVITLTVHAGVAHHAALAADRVDGLATSRLAHPFERLAVAQAIEGAARRLAQPECQELLDEFTDAAGQPLRAAIDARGLSVPEYLGRVFFNDAAPSNCRSSNLALTTPGSRAIHVCGQRFVNQSKRNSRHAEATILHGVLHTLGLGENPPSSDVITHRVITQCGGR